MLLFHRNIVADSEDKQREGVEAWLENMDECLDGKVKYAKSVERILGSKGCVYHAVVYRDIDALVASSTSPTLRRLDLPSRIKSSVWTSDATAVMWTQLDAMARAAYGAMNKEPPQVPSRDDIRNEIKRRKRPSSSSAETTDTTVASVANLLESLSLPAVTDAEAEAFCVEFTKLCDLHGDADASAATPLSQLLLRKDTKSFDLLVPHMASFGTMDKDAVTAEHSCWDALAQLQTTLRIRAAMPTNVMKTIEDYAASLADEVTSGRMGLANMDLEKVGTDVMSKLSEKEIEALMQNMPNLMPAMNDVMRNMGINGMPPM